ncbi:hypothetical protein DFH09DRAFT_1301740 [Mycena vulgaris]|nr:hypothetical protein DFH09DRAFT_1301740 [Mycena vulgaris]
MAPHVASVGLEARLPKYVSTVGLGYAYEGSAVAPGPALRLRPYHFINNLTLDVVLICVLLLRLATRLRTTWQGFRNGIRDIAVRVWLGGYTPVLSKNSKTKTDEAAKAPRSTPAKDSQYGCSAGTPWNAPNR